MGTVFSLRDGLTAEGVCAAYASIYVPFGIMLVLSGEAFFGGKSPFSYWTSFGEAGQFFGRTLGFMFVLVFSSPFWAGVPAEALVKVLLPLSIATMGQFIQAAAFLPARPSRRTSFSRSICGGSSSRS